MCNPSPVVTRLQYASQVLIGCRKPASGQKTTKSPLTDYVHNISLVLLETIARYTARALWLGTSLLSCHALAMSEAAFVTYVDSHAPKIELKLVDSERNLGLRDVDTRTRAIVARYQLVQFIIVLNQKFSQLGCDPLLDYAAKKRIFRDSNTELMQWAPKYAAYFRGELVKLGADTAMMDGITQRTLSQLRCN